MSGSKVAVLDERVIRMPCDVVVARREVDTVDKKGVAVHVDRVGVVGARAVLLARSRRGRIEHLDPGQLAVIAAQLQDMVRALGVQRVRQQAVGDMIEVDSVRPEHVVVLLHRLQRRRF